MDNLDRTFLAMFRQPGFARRVRGYGVMKFRRQLRQAMRLTAYPLCGDDRFRVPDVANAMMRDVLARAGYPSP